MRSSLRLAVPTLLDDQVENSVYVKGRSNFVPDKAGPGRSEDICRSN
jgi:hypothetical protein